MTDLATLDAYGVLTEPATVKIQRLLPGSQARVWEYLTQSDLRRQWLASGEMEMKVGGGVELVWRNNELTTPAGTPPPGVTGEHRMSCRITELDPPRKLAISWGETGGVEFELEQQGHEVLLTVTHHRLPDRSTLLNVSAGWHAHLDVLAARVAGEAPTPFWDSWTRLKAEYDQRLPA